MKKTLLLLSIFLSVQTFAQPSAAWQKCLGTAASETGNSVELTADGGFIIGATVVIPPAEGELMGSENFWIAKTDGQGETQWQGSYGSGTSTLSSICQTADGGYIAIGKTLSGGGDVTGYHGSRDGWILKLSASGEIQWTKCVGGSGLDELTSVLQTADGSYLVAGHSSSVGDDMPANFGGRDGWVIKLDSLGAVQWTKNYGGTNDDRINSIVATADGGFAFAGYSSSFLSGTWDIQNPHDGWIVKANADGTVQWNSIVGESNYRETFVQIIATADGGFVAAGSLNGTGPSDVLAVKIDNQGNVQWQQTVETANINMGFDVAATGNGYLISAMKTANPEDITEPDGIFDASLIKLGLDGDILWTETYAGSGNESFQSIKFLTDGSLVALGYTSSTDGDITAVGHGGNDVWLVKFAPEILAVPETYKPHFYIYPNPAHATIELKLPEGMAVESTIITDLSGKIVARQNGFETTIDIGNLASGSYILTAVSGGQVFKSRFIKQ